MPADTDPDHPTPGDRVLRAMTDDGSFRVIVLRSTETVRAAVAAQEAQRIAALQLGELITGAVLVRETMAPGQRVQVLLRDGAGNLITGDAFPGGGTRGLVQVEDALLGIRSDEGGTLQVLRSLPGRAPHQGVLDVEPYGGIGDGLCSYFARSEQIETFVAVRCVLGDDGAVAAAGGYVVQLLPEVTAPPLAAMRERLRAFGDLGARLTASDDPRGLLHALLEGTDHTELGDSPVVFACGCGAEKALSAVAALGEQELQEALGRGEVLRVRCDYCRTVYEVGPEEYRAILARGG